MIANAFFYRGEILCPKCTVTALVAVNPAEAVTVDDFLHVEAGDADQIDSLGNWDTHPVRVGLSWSCDGCKGLR